MSDASGVEQPTSAEVVRHMIEHENVLRDQRLGWMFALNGFLFTALAFMWENSKSVSLIIAALGVALAVAHPLALYVARRAGVPLPRVGSGVHRPRRRVIRKRGAAC
jgi:hypothetical protein